MMYFMVLYHTICSVKYLKHADSGRGRVGIGPQDAATAQPRLSRIVYLRMANVPAHLAIIMDGNGRWAEQRGQPL